MTIGHIDHEKWAKKALEYLVDHVRHFEGGHKFVYYKQLAERIGYPKPHTGSFFASQIGKTLGKMGHLIENETIDGERPPRIQYLVVRKQTGMPGDGIKEFYPEYPKLSKDKKKDYIVAEYRKIFEYGSRWDKLLIKLGITNAETSSSSSTHLKLHNPYGSEGSPEHMALRDYIYENPGIVGVLPHDKYKEYPLKSGDFIDVLLGTGTEIVGVEVKSKRSGVDDLERGIFQCVKYKAVLEAESILSSSNASVSCVLVIESELPQRLRNISDKLGVKVYENITPRSVK